MLPTNQKAHIFMNAVNKKLLLDMESELHRVLPSGKYQHLYFLSNNEIKEGDWVYSNCKHTSLEKDNYRVFKCTRIGNTGIVFGEIGDTLVSSDSINWCKKIIATTDTSLQYAVDKSPYPMEVYGLPTPSQSFIEKYIKEYNNNTPITDVLVEYILEHDLRTSIKSEEFKEVPKINKDNTITIKKVKNSWSREEVVEKLIECCAEISSTNGTLIGKSPAELYKWIETNL